MTFGKRNIAEKTLKNVTCDFCKAEDSIFVSVFAKFFVMKFLVFFTGKTLTATCTSCQKEYKSLENVPQRLKDRIEAVKESAEVPNGLYSGYGLLVVIVLLGLLANARF